MLVDTLLKVCQEDLTIAVNSKDDCYIPQFLHLYFL